MKFATKLAAVGGAVLLATAFAVSAESMVTNMKGMTLYTFDNDAGGKPTCEGDCAKIWPPYAGLAGENFGEGWTLVPRADGTLQWAYDTKPVYFFVKDTKAGEMLGDGVKGIWHVIKE